jgi:hypothetical protein
MAKNKHRQGKAEKPAPALVQQRSREQLYAEGKAIRDSCPRSGHAGWKPPADRADPIEILEASEFYLARIAKPRFQKTLVGNGSLRELHWNAQHNYLLGA